MKHLMIWSSNNPLQKNNKKKKKTAKFSYEMYTYMHPLSSRIVEPCLFRLYALSTFSLTSLGRLYHIPPFLYAHALSSILKLTCTKNKINIINSLKKNWFFMIKNYTCWRSFPLLCLKLTVTFIKLLDWHWFLFCCIISVVFWRLLVIDFTIF